MINKEKSDENESQERVQKEERVLVIPGETIISRHDYLPGEGTRKEGEDIIATRFGLADTGKRVIKVIPLSGTYMPRVGNVVIGKVIDVTFNGWIIDIRAPYQSFLPLMETPRFIKGDLKEFYDIGDMMACEVYGVKAKGVDLTINGRGLGKLEHGMIMCINSNKVPRVIGKEGSMIKLIKDETKCDIIVGQNGIVWIKGNTPEDELRAKEAVLFVVEKSFIDGLTEKVEEFLKNGEKL